jgi:hypothetical protein
VTPAGPRVVGRYAQRVITSVGEAPAMSWGGSVSMRVLTLMYNLSRMQIWAFQGNQGDLRKYWVLSSFKITYTQVFGKILSKKAR